MELNIWTGTRKKELINYFHYISFKLLFLLLTVRWCNMKMKPWLFTILCFITSPSVFSQKASYYKKLFIDAEYFVLFKEYVEALPLFIEIFNYEQDNMNAAYRIGECYLNIPNQKHKALDYLQKASNNISDEYKVGMYTEKYAPKEVYYLLGIAYRIENNFDKATEMLNEYKKKLTISEIDKKQEVEFQIEIIGNAKEMMKNPVQYTAINLGDHINTTFPNVKPVISGNDSVLAYVSELRFYDAVFWSSRKDGKWSLASNLTPFFGSDGDLNTCAFSYDGNTLYMNRYDWDNQKTAS